MKHITTQVGGYIVCGHMALKADGIVTIDAPDHKEKMARRLIKSTQRLCPIDRVVGAAEFAQATGLTVELVGGKIAKPLPVKKISKKQEPYTFIKL